MHAPRSSLFLVVAIGLANAAFAQSTLLLPAYADAVDGHQSHGLPFGSPSFRTQILVDATQLSPNGALISGIRFRADRWLAPVGALQVPNVTVALSQTNVTPAAVSPTFAANATSPAFPVFQGTVSLPAQGTGFAGPLPWNIVVSFAQQFSFTQGLGNLLIDITAANPAGGPPSYILDAVQAGGAATQFGVSGINPNFDTLLLYVTTGNNLDPRLVSPGHSIDFVSTLFFTSSPGFVALGLSPQPTPIDLSSVGAPTNSLYIDPILYAAHAWSQTFIGWMSTFSLAVPNNSAFLGTRIYGQSAIMVPAANPLGVITSHAVESRLGDEFEVFGMRQIDATSATAASGTILDFSFGPQPEFGAVAVRLDGLFF